MQAFLLLSVIVESEAGFRYIVDYDRKVDKEKITEETRVFLHMRTLTIMGILPRQVYISMSHYSWITIF